MTNEQGRRRSPLPFKRAILATRKTSNSPGIGKQIRETPARAAGMSCERGRNPGRRLVQRKRREDEEEEKEETGSGGEGCHELRPRNAGSRPPECRPRSRDTKTKAQNEVP